ncbi:alkaline phosphatase family protein [Danxiaibacter flavus]|uniref:Alkaline phosphatase family protein n=1 Tax=Danxiaibacter flavus TaxID=3049108 RepID=A0ABV3ZQ37_9BACT|nr:alkaline phosphatase family protein [Chitinophagaceae bacterium DXS]
MKQILSNKIFRIFLVAGLFTIANCPAKAQSHKTENVVIVTLDGMRWQEVFGGIDAALLNNPKYTRDKDNLEEHFGADVSLDKRKKLFPFFWSIIEQNGQLYGNRNVGSNVNVANPYKISYPGYNEMLTGCVDTGISKNDKIPNPNVTILEYINKQNKFADKVAAFATWDRFPYILNEDRSGIYINADDDTLSLSSSTAAMYNSINKITPRPLGCRPDLITYLYAKEYMKQKKPKVLLISFLETDYAAHNGMYDLYITSAHAEDAMIADLWNTLQQMREYKDKTTLIITCDHGRGDKIKEQWTSHGGLIDSGGTWIAVMGPDTQARGEVHTESQLYQKQIAPTIGKLLGLDFMPKDSTSLPIKTIVQ